MEAKSVVAENTGSRKEEVEIDNANKENICNNVEKAAGSGDDKFNSIAATAESSSQKKKIKKNKSKNNRIQVSKNKKPFVFYLNLAKRFIKQYSEVELSALGMAIPTVVTIAEILKRDGSANYKEVNASAVDYEDDNGLFHHKPKILIVMSKTGKLNTTNAVAADTTPKKAVAADTTSKAVAAATLSKATASATPNRVLTCITPAKAVPPTTVKKTIAV